MVLSGSRSRGRGGRTASGVRTYNGQNATRGLPPRTQPRYPTLPPPVPAPKAVQPPNPNEEGGDKGGNPRPNPPQQNPNPNVDDNDVLDRLLALPGHEHLPLLSEQPIAGIETLWFNRHKGRLSRAIAGIFRRKFDGPYYSWKVTPIPIQERYFKTFARKFRWDSGIIDLVKEGFLKIAKKRMKGIVSQAKRRGVQPSWIRDTLWAEMWEYWDTHDAIEKSENASRCRKSTRVGLGVHKHLSGQKSFVQVHQEMEEELGRLVSLSEVFMKTHTRADGTFVDQKAKHVAETYEKTIEEKLTEMNGDGLHTSDNSPEHSSHQTLNIGQNNEIFLKCTQTYIKGNPFGLGSLVETLNKRKGKRAMRAHQLFKIFKINFGAR
ncbi:PREDICTED: uncharacterized protein LOC104779290 [Camelina sativa]|uniref:Uncharacterized protein LOC104779290 n=1 Tax=Camelina sativa TaxID=90675 RepID=A0ABM0YJI3_CAMSA|nr:PREDICTED: uncharacterized protein LOC104779290 [Camelina sativa]